MIASVNKDQPRASASPLLVDRLLEMRPFPLFALPLGRRQPRPRIIPLAHQPAQFSQAALLFSHGLAGFRFEGLDGLWIILPIIHSGAEPYADSFRRCGLISNRLARPSTIASSMMNFPPC